MKPLFVSISLLILFIGCKRDWDHPLFTDEDLTNTPNIVQIDLDSDNNANIIMDYAYSDSSTTVLERKPVGSYEIVHYHRKTKTVLVDTSYDKEIDHDFVYRIYVKKGNYRTPYSEEEQFNYISHGLNQPEDLTTTSEELQGINLFWKDKSNHEESYKIEKDEGGGFNEVVTLPANSESYFDAISGIPDPPLQLAYRVKAVNTTKESDWTGITLAYAGLGSPTDLEITNSSPANFRIEWQDNSGIETGFSIERKKDLGNFAEIGQVGADTSFFHDRISELGTYTYHVRTIKDGLFSSFSNEISHEVTTIIPTDGLIAYYPFNGNANDESGNANDGSVNGAALTIDRFGNSDDAYSFNGINDYIEVTHNTSLNLTTALSISIWINTKNEGYLIAKGDYNYYAVSVNDLWEFRTNLNADKFTTPFNDWNEWKSLVITYDKNSGELIQYIDGVKKNTSYYSKTINTTTANLQIGRRLPSHFYFDGIIDDIRIYNRAITNEEVFILYHEGGWDE